MADPVIFQSFVAELGKGTHDMVNDSFKLLLTNSAPSASSDTEKSDITEISAGNGYTSGGIALTVTSWSQSGGVAKWVLADATLTASGGAISEFQYAVIYNDSAANDELVLYIPAPSAVNIADGNTYIFDADPSTGVMSLSIVTP